MENIEEFKLIIKDIEENQTVQKMKHFRQHCDISCYEHCYNVAYYSYKICKKLKLDYTSVSRARNVT
jgi:HD superfamily phosphodiesterase